MISLQFVERWQTRMEELAALWSSEVYTHVQSLVSEIDAGGMLIEAQNILRRTFSNTPAIRQTI